jgi:phage terminase large subunit-like protein
VYASNGPGAEEWERLVLPLYADEGVDDPLGRASGEMLWPARFAASDIPSVTKGEISSRSFAALYQQRPQPAGGDLVKLDWLSARYKRLPTELTTIAALDAATKTGVGNDYSVIVVLGVAQQAYYVLDVVRRKVELVQTLRRETRLPIVSVVPHGSKIARFEAVSGLLESRRVLLPEDAPWLDEFERELLSFPGGKFDDQVDALVLGLSRASVGSSTAMLGWLSNVRPSPITLRSF